MQMRWWYCLNFENMFVEKKKYFENVLVKMMKKIK
jgi:hypothetical protein